MRFLISIFLINICVLQAGALFKTGTILQDDEIEEVSTFFCKKLFEKAKIQIKPTIYLVMDPDINAAATLKGTLILNTGFITACKNVEEFIGVLAHETAHIKAAHPALFEMNLNQSITPGFFAMALGGVAALLSGNGEFLIAGLSGGMSMMERGALKYSRTQEYVADAGGIELLELLNWPITGMASFLGTIYKKYGSSEHDPYIRTHPLTSERIGKIETYLKEHGNKHEMPQDLKDKFLRIKGKVFGFSESPKKILKLYPSSQKQVDIQYARAIAFYRLKKEKEFETEMDVLLTEYPEDTYFQELKGQFYLEKGKYVEAVRYLKLAKKDRKKSYGLDLMLANAFVHNKATISEAVSILKPHVQKYSDSVFGWRLLAMAYGKLGKKDFASECLAEEAYLRKDYKMALIHAKRAKHSNDIIIKDRAQTLMQAIEQDQKQ